MAKVAILLLAGCAMVMASPLPRFESFGNEIPNVADQLQNAGQQVQNSVQNAGQQLQEIPQQTLQTLQKAVGQIAEKLGEAYAQAFDQQEQSVHQALNSVQDFGQKGVESTVNLFKNGLGFIAFIPRIIRNSASAGTGI